MKNLERQNKKLQDEQQQDNKKFKAIIKKIEEQNKLIIEKINHIEEENLEMKNNNLRNENEIKKLKEQISNKENEISNLNKIIKINESNDDKMREKLSEIINYLYEEILKERNKIRKNTPLLNILTVTLLKSYICINDKSIEKEKNCDCFVTILYYTDKDKSIIN